MTLEQARRDHRLLVLAPTTRDAAMTERLLSDAGIGVTLCPDLSALVREVPSGAAAVLVTEEKLGEPRFALGELLRNQPPWSDLPILILTRPGADAAELVEAVGTMGNVTLLDRPVRIATLISAVRTALRARERQYQIRGHLAERAFAEEQMRAADRRKDEFLATLGHELRNPLAPLLTSLHLLKLANPRDSVVIRAATVMERQVNHLVRLVDDLLEVSRITRGVIDVHKEPLALELVLRASVETSRPAIEASGHTLTVRIADPGLTVLGDSVRLTQVFSNLLSNAAKYTNTGGHIELAAHAEGGAAVISVSDDGMGIEPHEIGSVFDMFMQAHRSDRRTQGGLGIGLTIVQNLVRMHGGTVEARSDGAGRGSRFIVRLPLETAVPATSERPAEIERFPSSRVLIVDDNVDAAETLGTLLGALGMTVSVVHSGWEALNAIPGFCPDIVLLDLGMPDMDGFEVARRIRSTPEVRHVVLVALTGWGQEEDVLRSKRAGFDYHLVKPPDIDQLRAIVRAVPSHLHAASGDAPTPSQKVH